MKVLLAVLLVGGTGFAQSVGVPVTLDGSGSSILNNPVALDVNGAMWLFDSDATAGDLRYCIKHQFASTCTTPVVFDGDSTIGGRTTNIVGAQPVAAVLYDGLVHVFYADEPVNDAGVENNERLRHATINPKTLIVTYEIVDGAGGPNGRTAHPVGGWASAIQYGSSLFVSYYDKVDGNLRLAQLFGGNWSFQTLDGAGGFSGRINADVGRYSTLLATFGYLQIFYSDETNQDMRQAWLGSTWSFAARDGAGGAGTTNAVNGKVGAIVVGSITHLFYLDRTAGALRHAWDIPGSGWSFAVQDSSAGFAPPAAISDGTMGHVFYSSGSVLKHNWALNYQPWSVELVDPSTTVFHSMGATMVNGAPNVVYTDLAWDIRWAH